LKNQDVKELYFLGDHNQVVERTMGAENEEPEEVFDTTPGNDVTESDDELDVQRFEPLMESIVRVTLAGLGGSLVGLSQEKKFESMRVVTGAASAAAARRKRSPSAPISNLPLTWAISCMTFCVIIETSRLTSPTSLVWTALRRDESSLDTSLSAPIRTIGDYTFGGAVGGIAGSFGRNTHLRQRLPSAMFKGPRRFFGLLPGMVLGFAAGVLQASTDYGVVYLESMRPSVQAEASNGTQQPQS
jgi:hypothetical protein